MAENDDHRSTRSPDEQAPMVAGALEAAAVGASPNSLSSAKTASLSVGAAAPRPGRASPRFPPHKVIASRYEIVRFIGRGGMGEVYEANDSALHEHVALKTVLLEIASDRRAAQRFIREIQLARKVTHPNVCRIFDVGHHEEEDRSEEEPQHRQITFLTMELLHGETLAQHIQDFSRMTTVEAQPVIEQIAAGLEAAHEVGVIHRDLKCGNVILVPAGDRTRVVITDFGLARADIPDEIKAESISERDEVIGTPDYMSPEQVRGEPVTCATDIYSLGIVMYVITTGKLPFKSHSPRATALKRLEEDPPSPRGYVPELNPTWEEVILRCLARDPKDRYARASDVTKALRGEFVKAPPQIAVDRARPTLVTRRTLAASVLLAALILVGSFVAIPAFRQRIRNSLATSVVPEQKLLAILPFTAISGDTETGAFAKGLAETLTSRLTGLTEKHSLQVIPSSELLGSHVGSISEARREFGVNLGLEGSVERSGNQVRVSYHLVDATKGRQLRGDTITAAASEPFALEDEVALSVARALEIELAPQEKSALSSHRATEPAAYDFYLQGRGYLQDFVKPENVESAITVFNHALELDGRYAPAYAGLGEAYWYRFEATRESAWVNKATSVCEKAVAVDEQSAQAHECLGTIYQGTGKYELAAQEFQRAVDLEPTSDNAVRGLASAYASLGKPAEAEETYRRSINLRPHYWSGYNTLGVFYFGQARYGEAAQMFRQVIALAPDNYRGYSNLGAVYVLEGRYSEAIPLFQQAGAIQPSADAYSNLATTYFHLRQFSEAARIFAQAVQLNDRDYVMWGNLADAEIRTQDKKVDAAAAFKTAISLAEQELQVNPKNTRVLGNLADYYSMLRNNGQSLKYVQRALSLDPDDPAVRYNAAQVYEQLGDHDAAVQWLVKALNAGYPSTMVRDSPAMDSLRSDPRVKSLLHPQ
jgi:serine/threonine protein kinase/tetratricopeptide (TPR) repeat protein